MRHRLFGINQISGVQDTQVHWPTHDQLKIRRQLRARQTTDGCTAHRQQGDVHVAFRAQATVRRGAEKISSANRVLLFEPLNHRRQNRRVERVFRPLHEGSLR